MPPEPLSTIEGIKAAVVQDPRLRFDPNIKDRYTSLGGTLSNFAIPEPVSTLSSSAGETVVKDADRTFQEARNRILPTQPTTPTKPTAPQGGLTDSDVAGLMSDGGYKVDQFTKNQDNSYSVKLPSANAEMDDYKKTVEAQSAQYDQFTKLFGDIGDRQILGLKNAMAQDLALQEEINTREQKVEESIGVRLGTTRYAPRIQGGVMSDVSSKGLQRLTTIKTKYEQAIADADMAKTSKQWDVFVKKTNDIKEYQKMAVQEASKIAEEQRKVLTEKMEKNSDLQTQGLLGEIWNKMTTDGTFTRGAFLSEASKLVPMDKVKTFMDLMITEAPDVATDLKLFNGLLADGRIPKEILALPKDKQYLAFKQAIKEAEDVSDNYLVITDPITGNQSIFDKHNARFMPGGGGGGGSTPASFEATREGEIILNAANNLLVKLGKDKGQLAARSVAQKVQKGDLEGAFNDLKTHAYNSLPGPQQESFKMLSDSFSYYESALDSINKSSVTSGPYKELYESKKPYLLIEKDPKYVNLRQLTGLGDAEVRRAFFGTAVTITEKGTADTFLFNPNDDINTIKNKIRGNLAVFSFANDVTTALTLGLPKPNLQTYLDRYGAYVEAETKNVGGVDYRRVPRGWEPIK